MNLQGKTVLITGAARRIGREIALTLVRRGARILIHYRDSKADALLLQAEIQTMGGEALRVKADFSHRPRPLLPVIQKFINEIYQKVANIDVLVNNASLFYPTPFGAIKESDWDAFLAVNLKVPFFLSQEIGKRMMQQKRGKIINLVDWTARRPHPKYLPYAISKAGLAAATEGLAKALAPHVQVISVAPGPILPTKDMKPNEKKAVAGRTLLKRFGHPKDIANTVRFLIEDTDFMTGAFIPVEGGSLLC